LFSHVAPKPSCHEIPLKEREELYHQLGININDAFRNKTF
jgi:hypothetical protein